MQTPTSWTASSADVAAAPEDLSALAGRWNEALDVHLSSPYRMTSGPLQVQILAPPQRPTVELPTESR